MAADETNKLLMQLALDFDPKKALKKSSEWERAYSAQMKKVQASMKGLDSGMGKFVTSMRGAGLQYRELINLTDKLAKAEKIRAKVGTDYEQMKEAANQQKVMLVAIAKAARKAKGDERKQLLKSLEEAKRLTDKAFGTTYRQKRAASATLGKKAAETGMHQLAAANADATSHAEETKEKLEAVKESGLFELDDLIRDAETAGEALVSPIEVFSSKDLPKMMAFSAKAFTSAMNAPGAIKGWLKARKEAKAAADGADGAKEMKAGQGGLKDIIKAVGGLGPMLQILSAFSAGFVKMLIDAEATAKEYNRTILATAGSNEFLNASFGNAADASDKLGGALRDLRDQSMSVDNMMWGISKDTASSVISSLTAEGVSLLKLRQATEAATKSHQGFVDSQGAVIRMSVAYSRAFGVSLNEITQLQGTMMTEMGMGLEGVEASFARIAEGAREAGIASNKFFSIISSFSADMSLFALRMEEITSMMKVLGRAMSPRDAQKFMQTLAGKFVGSQLENIRTAVIAGKDRTQQNLAADLDPRMRGLVAQAASQLGLAPDSDRMKELYELLKKRDPKKTAAWLVKAQQETGLTLSGAIRGSISDMQDTYEKVSSGNVHNLAAAMGSASVWRKFRITDDAIGNVFKGKHIRDLDKEEITTAVNSGMLTEEARGQYQKMEQGLAIAKEELVSSFQDALADPTHKQMTNSQVDQLARLGIGANAEGFEKLQKLLEEDTSSDRFVASLSESQAEALGASEKVIGFQEKTASYQTSALDRLEAIAAILQNQIYGVMESVWDVIVGIAKKIPGAYSAESEKRDQARKAALATGNAGLMQAVSANPKDMYKARQQMVDTVGAEGMAQLEAMRKKYGELKKQLGSATGAEDKAGIEGQMKFLEPILNRWSRITSKGKLYERDGRAEQITATKKALAEIEAGRSKGDADRMRDLLKRLESDAYLDTSELATRLGDFSTVGKSLGQLGDAQKKAVEEYQRARRANNGAAPQTTSPGPVSPAVQGAGGTVQPAVAQSGVPAAAAGAYSEAANTNAAVAPVVQAVQQAARTPPPLPTKFANETENSMYNAMSRALFEYWMYSGLNRNRVAQDMGSGMNLQQLVAGATSGVAMSEYLTGVEKALPNASYANASGGVVSGIANRMASIQRFPRPPSGEGWASVGPGETILPAGARTGGGGAVKVELELKGDFRKFIDARVIDGNVAHERAKRSR